MNQVAHAGRHPAPALLAVAAVLALAVPPLLTPPAASPATPVFPSTVAPYSWWTGSVSSARLEAAAMLYRNGVGVEFLDAPQAVLLGTDGSTYRRLDLAETLSAPADQGDPARSVLSPDGTFVVVGGPDGQGAVRVTTLRDGAERTLPVGKGRSAIPVGIGADGRSVLLVTGEGELSPLLDADFRLHGQLARIDLLSGVVSTYPELTDVNAAALSPDGTRILLDTAGGLLLADARDGTILDGLTLAGPRHLDGDAWSPDGSRAAVMAGTTLLVVDPTRPTASARLPITGIDSGAAIGWRDPHTVLVHAATGNGANTSEFLWVDADTGAQETFSTYAPDVTVAALASADVALDLVPRWQVAARPVDRGPLGLGWLALLAGLAGLVSFALTPTRPVTAPREPVTASGRPGR